MGKYPTGCCYVLKMNLTSCWQQAATATWGTRTWAQIPLSVLSIECTLLRYCVNKMSRHQEFLHVYWILTVISSVVYNHHRKVTFNDTVLWKEAKYGT